MPQPPRPAPAPELPPEVRALAAQGIQALFTSLAARLSSGASGRKLREGAAAPAPASTSPRGLPALPAIPALGLYEMPQIELPRNWLDIFAPLPAPKPEAPASAPEPTAPLQYDMLPALPSRNRKLLQRPGMGAQQGPPNGQGPPGQQQAPPNGQQAALANNLLANYKPLVNVRPVLHINTHTHIAELAGGDIELPGGIKLPIPQGIEFPTTGALSSLEDLPGVRPRRYRRAYAPAGAPRPAPVLIPYEPPTAPAAVGAPSAQPPSAQATTPGTVAFPKFEVAPARPGGGLYNAGEQIQDTITKNLGNAFSALLKAGGRRRLLQGPPGGQQALPHQQPPPQQQGPPANNQGQPPPLDPNARFVGVSPELTVDYEHNTATIQGGTLSLAGHSVNIPNLDGIKLPAEPVLTVLRLIRDPSVLALDRVAQGLAPAPSVDEASAAAAAPAPAVQASTTSALTPTMAMGI
ncbi:hypothetical protein WJX81_003114 [Elliptochloris bilobata]|uniref:Uncharacterized protein n=1 Tax=Elliptochloris bilobata TaxID=381761 RepID=A0AAW1RAL4_9CHLO